jgi:hypothetical protein
MDTGVKFAANVTDEFTDLRPLAAPAAFFAIFAHGSAGHGESVL